MMEQKLQTRSKLSPDNPGPYVVVISYILMSIMVLCSIARLRPGRHTFSKIPGLDECLLLLAMVIAIIESVLIQRSVQHGLGRRQSDLSAHDLDLYDKFTYINQLLYIAVLCLSKLSLVLFIKIFALARWAIVSCWVLLYAVGLWAVSTIFASAFQCQLPKPWRVNESQCIDRMALNYVIGVFNIFTDLLIFVIPTRVVLNLQINNERRLVVIAAFATRPIAIAVNIVQLYAVGSDFDSSDRTRSAYSPALWMQVVLHLSIITACIPSMRPLFKNLQSGVMDATLRSDPANPSTTNTWVLRTQSSSGWKSSTTRARMESYTQRSDGESGA